MRQEDIHELLNRLALFPKPYPRTIEGVVKAIERQRWAAIQGENEGCVGVAEGACREIGINHDMPCCCGSAIAAAIRARVNS